MLWYLFKTAYAVMRRAYAILKNRRHFWDHRRLRFRVKSKAQNHIQIDVMLRCEFSPENALGDGPRVLNFPGFTDKG